MASEPNQEPEKLTLAKCLGYAYFLFHVSYLVLTSVLEEKAKAMEEEDRWWRGF